MTLPSHLSDMLYRMWLIRYFDASARELYMQNLMRGTTHTYTGQEAVAVGACAALRRDDYISSTHRGHGHCLAKGGDPKRMMAELLGKATGYCKGKGGSMHIADFELGILGANGIVGGGIGLATGAAYSADVRGSGQVVVCFFGDGASNQGILMEAGSMASLWKLPIIYLCEANQYAEFSPVKPFIAVERLELKAQALGMPGVTVDGNDVLAVYEATRLAVERARSGAGPPSSSPRPIESKATPWAIRSPIAPKVRSTCGNHRSVTQSAASATVCRLSMATAPTTWTHCVSKPAPTLTPQSPSPRTARSRS